MNQFERAIQQGEIPCDLCGASMRAMYGGGSENDMITCTNRSCVGEIIYPTSTEVVEDEDETDAKPKAEMPGKRAMRDEGLCPGCGEPRDMIDYSYGSCPQCDTETEDLF